MKSIDNSIKHNPKNPQVESEPLLGRIVDAMNYLRLFQCLLVEDSQPIRTYVNYQDIQQAYESQSAQ